MCTFFFICLWIAFNASNTVTPNILPVIVELALAVTWSPVEKNIVSLRTLGFDIGVVFIAAASSSEAGEVFIFLSMAHISTIHKTSE